MTSELKYWKHIFDILKEIDCELDKPMAKAILREAEERDLEWRKKYR
jgi:hypothetical protein